MYTWICLKEISQFKEKAGIFNSSMLDNPRKSHVTQCQIFLTNKKKDIILRQTKGCGTRNREW